VGGWDGGEAVGWRRLRLVTARPTHARLALNEIDKACHVFSDAANGVLKVVLAREEDEDL
jgi:hypothetical protein